MAVNKQGADRIGVLDAFRAIAVLWVVLYHFAYFWTPAGAGLNLLPYGDAAAGLFLADVGYLGVTLFFLISGYVISLTLFRTKSLRDFAVKRLARLWPSLLFCGSLTYLTTLTIGIDALKVGFAEYAVSLFFLPPEHVGRLFGQEDWRWLDGAYWSLWVEARYYAVIGFLFYAFPRLWFHFWLAFEAFGWAVGVLAAATGDPRLDMAEGLLFSAYTPFFTLGAVVYKYHNKQFDRLAAAATILSAAHALYTILSTEQHASYLSIALGYGLITALFGAFALSPAYLRRLEVRPLLNIGRSSYALYLLHQVVGLCVIAFVAKYAGAASMAAAPLTVAFLLILAHAVFRWIEQPSNKWIVKKLRAK